MSLLVSRNAPESGLLNMNFSNPFQNGIGPLLWSPLSEVPAFWRNILYMISFLFVILSIPTALVNNLGGFLVLRFLQGFFGGPCLANGGASLRDLVCLILNLNRFCEWNDRPLTDASILCFTYRLLWQPGFLLPMWASPWTAAIFFCSYG